MASETDKTVDKPLGQKAYGSIGHLPESRMGPGDHKLPEGQAAIATTKARDKHDVVIVTEKLDGSCCAVARLNGSLLALGRAGHLAQTSPYEQHQLFAAWVRHNEPLFDFLQDGERIVGEWLAQAHGTRYVLWHEPFAVFDLMRDHERAPFDELTTRTHNLPRPTVLHRGSPVSVENAMKRLVAGGHHGAQEPVEGAVWRVERRGQFDFLAKFVRPDKKDGAYLPEISNQEPVWNWRPDAAWREKVG